MNSIEVTTGSRLHFGMFALGDETERQFGGCGAMLAQPGIRLRFTPANHFSAYGPLAQRVEKFALSASRSLGLPGVPRCRVDVLRCPLDHLGLGTGTQLGLSVAAGLRRFSGMCHIGVGELAQAASRARRSSVGSYGFERGGLIVEEGTLPGERLAPLLAHVDIPGHWRFVLLRPDSKESHWRGLYGRREQQAFRRLPRIEPAVSRRLRRIALARLVPAARAVDFDSFSEALFEYGYEAGLCFAAAQGGPFAGPQLAHWINVLRQHGIAGVGQSSWGPTLFALQETAGQAESLAAWLKQAPGGADLHVTISSPRNQGAEIQEAPQAACWLSER